MVAGIVIAPGEVEVDVRLKVLGSGIAKIDAIVSIIKA